MEQERFTTQKMLMLGLIFFLSIQLSHLLTLFVILPLDPFYDAAGGRGSFQDEIVSVIAQWYSLFLVIGLLIVIVAALLEFSDPTSVSLREKIGLVVIGLLIICIGLFVQLSLTLQISPQATWEPHLERFILYSFGLLVIVAPILLIGLFMIATALFRESSPAKGPLFIQQDIRHLIPDYATSSDILKTGIAVFVSGIIAFNIFLLFEPLPVFEEWSIRKELLIVSGEVIVLGLVFLFLTVLFDRGILPGLDKTKRTLPQTIQNAFQTVRSTNKVTIFGVVFLIIGLLFIEYGLLLVEFTDEKWVIDPLLDFLDSLMETTGSLVNPVFAELGLDIEIRPLFTPGDWTESEPALFRVIFRHLGRGAVLTFTASLAALFFGFLLGTFCGTIRVTSHIPIPLVGRRISHWVTVFLQKIVSSYVEIFRGTPLMAQIFFIWFGLPTMIKNGIPFPLIGWEGGEFSYGLGIYSIKDPDFVLNELMAGILALSLNTAAYQSEIVRSGIQAIPSGQLEAARSLGMPYSQGMRYVVLPQAFRLIIPPLTNEFINLLLNSSLLSIISVFEITREARNLNNTTFRSVEVFGCLMLAYFAMTFVLSRIFQRIEERFRIPGLGVT